MYEFLWEYRYFFLTGIKWSLILAFVPIALGFLVGLLAALADVYGGKIASALINIYVEFFRGSPLVVQAVLFYWTIPELLGIRYDRLVAALIAFTLNSGAYQKGYIKGAIEAVYEDQMMAARSLGMSKLRAIRHVVLPQALRVVIPGWTNEYASMSMSTSAALIIGAGPELTTMAQSVASHTFRSFETYTFTALIYFIWIFSTVKVLEIIYEKVKIPGFEA